MSDLSNFSGDTDQHQIGEIALVHESNAHPYTQNGWLLCNGGVLSQASYPTLFSKLGTYQDSPSWQRRFVLSLLYKLIYSNGIFVGVGTTIGGSDRLITSTNKINWTSVGSHMDRAYDIIHENNIYVSCGTLGQISSSTNLNNWTTNTLYSGTFAILALTYGNGLYVYGGKYGTYGSSTNAINWTQRISTSTNNIELLVYGKGLYVYRDNPTWTTTNNSIFTSTNAINWTSRTTRSENHNFLIYGNGFFIWAGDSYSNGLSSTNAINWSTAANIFDFKYGYFDDKYTNLFYVIVSDKYKTSTNGINYIEIGNYAFLEAVYYGLDSYLGFNTLDGIYVRKPYSYDYLTSFVLPTNNSNTANLSMYIKAI